MNKLKKLGLDGLVQKDQQDYRINPIAVQLEANQGTADPEVIATAEWSISPGAETMAGHLYPERLGFIRTMLEQLTSDSPDEILTYARIRFLVNEQRAEGQRKYVRHDINPALNAFTDMFADYIQTRELKGINGSNAGKVIEVRDPVYLDQLSQEGAIDAIIDRLSSLYEAAEPNSRQ